MWVLGTWVYNIESIEREWANGRLLLLTYYVLYELAVLLAVCYLCKVYIGCKSSASTIKCSCKLLLVGRVKRGNRSKPNVAILQKEKEDWHQSVVI